jgi:hypothetical protein
MAALVAIEVVETTRSDADAMVRCWRRISAGLHFCAIVSNEPDFPQADFIVLDFESRPL